MPISARSGSPEGLFVADVVPPTERAARLLVDLLSEIHDVLLTAALEDETLIVDEAFIAKLDELADSISTVRVAGEVERSTEDENKAGTTKDAGIDLSLGANPSLGVHAGGGSSTDARELTKETRRGTEQISLHFAAVARALRALSDALPGKRLWLLLDEWSSVPADTQPYLAEFLVRCVLPLQRFTVKIAAIEQQTRFREVLTDDQVIGIELGADVAANVDLDEFMVFEQNEDRARETRSLTDARPPHPQTLKSTPPMTVGTPPETRPASARLGRAERSSAGKPAFIKRSRR
jgi:hypothetical protein